MMIQERIMQQLSDLTQGGELSSNHHTSGGRSVALVTGMAEVQVTLTLTDYDTYSVVLQQLKLTHAPLTTELAAWGEQIAQRFTYLDEPLAVVELEPTESFLQLRSNPPYTVDERIAYWEVVAHGDTTTLTRYDKQPDLPRMVLPHPVTFNVIGRFISDYVALIQVHSTE